MNFGKNNYLLNKKCRLTKKAKTIVAPLSQHGTSLIHGFTNRRHPNLLYSFSYLHLE